MPRRSFASGTGQANPLPWPLQDLGTLGTTGMPRMLDMGQCNDTYSALFVATELAKAVGAKSVNDLPLSLDIAWMEQKAVAILLTLLSLGVKRIRLGPKLPVRAPLDPSTGPCRGATGSCQASIHALRAGICHPGDG